MTKALKQTLIVLLGIAFAAFLTVLVPLQVHAEDADYTLNAVPVQGSTGVYTVTAEPGADKATATIGIPSVAKQTLADHPTTESPAIIMGAAVNYETKTGPTEYTPIPGASLVAPYSYFRWSVIQEQIQDEAGNITTHSKLSGFDGSYYIIRINMSDILAGVENPEGKYLHVKQESNKALMCTLGIEGTTFSDAMGNKTGSYSLADNAAALKDTTGSDTDTPYFDVIVLSSGKLAARADAGAADAPSADIGISFYIDETADYNPELTYDPASTDVNHSKEVLKKFFRDEYATEENTSTSYTIKGSDLEIDVTVDEAETSDGIAEFWSLTNAIAYQDYDSHVIKLICEVPVLEALQVESTDGSARSVILDVNSFDIQIANNTTTNEAGLTISQDAQLKLMDGTKTSGAELAIGNNATMIIENGGVLVIDESCVNEVEYDAATTTGGTDPSGTLLNGEIIVKNGGTIINNGVINVEGMEAKPLQPNPEEQTSGETVNTDMRNATMIVETGGLLQNYGCISLKGTLYIMGTLENSGLYNDLIVTTDPDKGTKYYHKGIQITWKDDVRVEGVTPGVLNIGIDADENVNPEAALINSGDIVVVPGEINLYGVLNNNGHIYLADVTEAVVPITPTAEAPLVVEIRVTLDQPRYGVLNVKPGSTISSVVDGFSGASVYVISNGVLGDLTATGEAAGNASIIKASDVALSAEDGVRGLAQNIDYILTDGGAEFFPEYLGTFAGERTVTINIGYRMFEFTVTGLLADYTAVDDAIASIPEDLSGYTAESVAALNAAVEAVDRTKTAEEQAEVDAMAQAILNAIDGLVPDTELRIVTQPVNTDAPVGGTISYSLEAVNAVSYQWYYTKDGVKWYKSSGDGAETSIITLQVKETNIATQYRCLLTGLNGEKLYSEIVGNEMSGRQLNIVSISSGELQVDKTETITVVAENAASYQWYYSKDGTKWYKSTVEAINGEGTSSITLTVGAGNYNNQYRCKVTGVDGTVKNSSATGLRGIPTITAFSADAEKSIGETATFSVIAENAASYQWYYSKDGGAKWYKSGASGADSDTMTINVKASNDGMMYRCKITAACGLTATSESAAVTVV